MWKTVPDVDPAVAAHVWADQVAADKAVRDAQGRG